MAYSQYTLASLTSEVSNTMGDTGGVYFTVPEIHYAIKEAMREWSADTSYWRVRGGFQTTPSTPWYDISALLPALRPRVVTVDDIVKEIQLHLSEPANGVSGSGMTTQFTISSILQAVVRARNRFCLDARLPLTLTPGYPVSSPPGGRLLIDQSTVYLHRAAWMDSNTIYTALHREDGIAEDAANPLWTITPSRPFAYSEIETRPIEIQLYPPPIASGTLELITVESTTLDTSLTTTTLDLPDDFAHAVKYAALGDLLETDGETSNPLVAQYCQARYKSVVDAAKVHKAVLRTQMNIVPIPLVPLSSLDYGRPYWYNSRGTPNMAGLAYELIGLSPVPNNIYGVTMDIAQSAPVPTLNGDSIQMGLEEIEVLVSYCEHYLSLKMGGSEFQQTFGLYDEFQRQAQQRNSILSAQSRSLTALFGQAQKEQEVRPYAKALATQ